jgi:hypothetical protein
MSYQINLACTSLCKNLRNKLMQQTIIPLSISANTVPIKRIHTISAIAGLLKRMNGIRPGISGGKKAMNKNYGTKRRIALSFCVASKQEQ